MQDSTFVGKVFGVLGAISLCIAAALGGMNYHDHHSGAWFASMGDSFEWTMIPVFLVLGIAGIAYAIRSGRPDKSGVTSLRIAPNPPGKEDAS
jgi:hypothetical protein